jgi:hypothetical protein
MMRYKSVFIPMLVIAVFCTAGPVWANDVFSVFVAPIASYIWLNGDFDGTRTVSGGGETMVIPAVAPGLAYGGLVGFKAPFAGLEGFSSTVEAQGMYAPLAGTFSSVPYDVEYFNIEGIMAVFYSFFGPLEVYVKAGVGFTWITVVNGASNGTTTGNFVIDGLEMGGGAGIAIDIFGIAQLRTGVSVHLSTIVHGSGIAISGSMEAVDDSPFMAEVALLFRMDMQ